MLVASKSLRGKEKHLRGAFGLPLGMDEAGCATGLGAERPRGALDSEPCHSVKTIRQMHDPGCVTVTAGTP